MPNLAAEEKRKRDILDRLARGPREWTPVTLDENDLERMQLDERTAFDDIRTDPALRAAQMEAIDRFGEIADQGYTVAEEAAMQRARTEANRDDASRRASIRQQMQMRGGGGGGAELAMMLSSADSAAERESQAALDAAARGQARGLEAMRARGSMAASLSDDEYQQKARAAEARDQIQRFNAGLTQNFLQGRATAQNQAGQWNAGQQNSWNWNSSELDYNDAVQNQNRKIAEEQEKRKRKQQRMNGALGGIGAVAGGIIGSTVAPGVGTMGGAALGSAAGEGLASIFSDERGKENIERVEPEDIDEFLSSIAPKNFDYKAGGKNRVGVMAQDIEQSPMGGRIVREGPAGKELDEDNLLGAILASLKRLEDKKRNK
jgi:hypothetical protein